MKIKTFGALGCKLSAGFSHAFRSDPSFRRWKLVEDLDIRAKRCAVRNGPHVLHGMGTMDGSMVLESCYLRGMAYHKGVIKKMADRLKEDVDGDPRTTREKTARNVTRYSCREFSIIIQSMVAVTKGEKNSIIPATSRTQYIIWIPSSATIDERSQRNGFFYQIDSFRRCECLFKCFFPYHPRVHGMLLSHFALSDGVIHLERLAPATVRWRS